MVHHVHVLPQQINQNPGPPALLTTTWEIAVRHGPVIVNGQDAIHTLAETVNTPPKRHVGDAVPGVGLVHLLIDPGNDRVDQVLGDGVPRDQRPVQTIDSHQVCKDDPAGDRHRQEIN